MAGPHYRRSDRYSYNHSLTARPPNYPDFDDGSSWFSSPRKPSMKDQVEPPDYKSRKSDYISRPAYSNTDYIAPNNRHNQYSRSSRSRPSNASQADYMSRPVESTHNHISHQFGSAASASTYINRSDNSQPNSSPIVEGSGFCQPIPSTKPYKRTRHASSSSPSMPVNKQNDYHRTDHASRRYEYGLAASHDRSSKIIYDYGNLDVNDHRSHRQSNRHHEYADGYGSDYETYPSNTIPHIQDEDEYGSDYQAYHKDQPRELYDVDESESDTGSDIISPYKITASTRRSPHPFLYSSSSEISSSPPPPRISLHRSHEADTVSSPSSFCSPTGSTPSRTRAHSQLDEEYGSDVEVVMSRNSSRGSQNPAGRHDLNDEYGSDVEISVDGGIDLMDSDWSSETEDRVVNDGGCMSDDDNIYGGYDYDEVGEEEDHDDYGY